AFLGWLYEHNDEKPPPGKFLKPSPPEVGGQEVTTAEFEKAVQSLVSHQLIADKGAWGSSIPLRTWLTDEGLICVTDYDADVNAWTNRGSANIDQSISFGGDNYGQVAANNRDVTQNQAQGDSLDLESLIKGATLIKEFLPGVPEDTRAEVEEQVGALLEEAEKPDRDSGRLRRLRDGLVTSVTALSSTFTVIKTGMDFLNAAG